MMLRIIALLPRIKGYVDFPGDCKPAEMETPGTLIFIENRHDSRAHINDTHCYDSSYKHGGESNPLNKQQQRVLIITINVPVVDMVRDVII
jgi:hypothetical protein